MKRETEIIAKACGILSSKPNLLAYCRKRGKILEFAPEEFKSDLHVVMTAIKSDPTAIAFASEELRANEEIIVEALLNDNLGNDWNVLQ